MPMVPLAVLESEITAAVEKLSESVVQITSRRVLRTGRGRRVPREAAGSGFIAAPSGLVVTNRHVVEGSGEVEVALRDGREVAGRVVGGDPLTDVALVRLDADGYPAAELGDSASLKVGQFALAIGHSLSLPGGPTVSVGVVSALGRPLPGADFIFEGLLQTDAAINPGNSGGPLADLHGRVVGINTAMIPYAQGVGFAIPVNTVKFVLEQLRENGRVVRPWLGISGVTLTPAIMREYNLSTASGVLIAEVVGGSPAEAAGLRAGDVLTDIGGFGTTRTQDLLRALSRWRPGEPVDVRFIRTGVVRTTGIRLRELPAPVAEN